MIRKIIAGLVNPVRSIKVLICKIRSIYLTYSLIDEGGGKILVRDPFIKIKVIKNKNSKLIVQGILLFEPHILANGSIIISIGEDAKFIINGDFIIGDGVKIFLEKSSELVFKGRRNESGSGITADSTIMVYRNITIGHDFICAWGAFISDSDWHQIGGHEHHKDVRIGDHVWVANNCNILKGSVIGNNCIIAGQSKIINKTYPDNVLIAGNPAKIVRDNVSWHRDLPKS